MKALNLTNQRFGKLLALERAPKHNDKYTRWICQCDCGSIIEVRTDYLTSLHTTSCGCEKAQYFQQNNLLNQRFGKLVVIKNLTAGKKLCQCDCGNICKVLTYNLTSGNTLSCGCLKSKGEEKINIILSKYKISFQTQYYFSDCRFPSTNRLAYFDYAIFNNNNLICLIEYDGPQHFTGWGQDTQSLKHIQEYDNIKTQYCKNNHIPLVRIPYTDYDKIDIDYLLQKMEEAQDEMSTEANQDS